MALIAGMAAVTTEAAPIVVELAGAPRGKGRPRRARLANGITIMHAHPKTAEYEANLRLMAQQVMNGREPLAGPLSVRVEAFFAVPGSWSKRRQGQALAGLITPTIVPDASNIACITDGCNSVIWHDDRQITELTVVKTYSARPRLTISVWPATEVSESPSTLSPACAGGTPGVATPAPLTAINQRR